MRKWADAQGEIGAAFDQHTILQRKFDAFVKHVSEQLCGPVLKPKELKLFSDDPSNWFEIHFAGRTLRFVFSACRGDGRTLKGRVTCFLLVTFPIARHVELGNFEFNTSGTTNLKIAEKKKKNNCFNLLCFIRTKPGMIQKSLILTNVIWSIN